MLRSSPGMHRTRMPEYRVTQAAVSVPANPSAAALLVGGQQRGGRESLRRLHGHHRAQVGLGRGAVLAGQRQAVPGHAGHRAARLPGRREHRRGQFRGDQRPRRVVDQHHVDLPGGDPRSESAQRHQLGFLAHRAAVHDFDFAAGALGGQHLPGQFPVLRPDHKHQHADPWHPGEGAQRPRDHAPAPQRQVHLVPFTAHPDPRAAGQHHGRRGPRRRPGLGITFAHRRIVAQSPGPPPVRWTGSIRDAVSGGGASGSPGRRPP